MRSDARHREFCTRKGSALQTCTRSTCATLPVNRHYQYTIFIENTHSSPPGPPGELTVQLDNMTCRCRYLLPGRGKTGIPGLYSQKYYRITPHGSRRLVFRRSVKLPSRPHPRIEPTTPDQKNACLSSTLHFDRHPTSPP